MNNKHIFCYVYKRNVLSSKNVVLPGILVRLINERKETEGSHWLMETYEPITICITTLQGIETYYEANIICIMLF